MKAKWAKIATVEMAVPLGKKGYVIDRALGQGYLYLGKEKDNAIMVCLTVEQKDKSYTYLPVLKELLSASGLFGHEYGFRIGDIVMLEDAILQYVDNRNWHPGLFATLMVAESPLFIPVADDLKRMRVRL